MKWRFNSPLLYSIYSTVLVSVVEIKLELLAYLKLLHGQTVLKEAFITNQVSQQKNPLFMRSRRQVVYKEVQLTVKHYVRYQVEQQFTLQVSLVLDLVLHPVEWNQRIYKDIDL